MERASSQSRSRRNLRALAVFYFATQSVLGVVWWFGIIASPKLAAMFFPSATVKSDLWTFLFADLFWFVGVSAIVSIAIRQNWAIASTGAWCLSGAVGYALFCCVGMLFHAGAWLSTILMLGSWLGTVFFAYMLNRGSPGPSDPDGPMEST